MEVTESAVVADVDAAVRCLDALHRHGVRIALDDFGTGHSSLQHLRQLPVDTLKIDRSFLNGGGAAPPLVQAIVDLGHALDLDTVVEGVERPEQLARFRRLACTRAQGFLLARPAAPERTTAELARAQPVTRAVRADRSVVGEIQAV